MNAIDLLIVQHRALESRIDALLDTNDPEQRARMLAEVGDQLTLHIASEEQIFYPAVKARRTEDILLESLEEHLSLKRLLADLLQLDISAQTFIPKLKVLSEQSEHHHKEEEENLFPKVRKVVDAQQLGILGEEMMVLQDQLQSQGRPREAIGGETEKAAPL